jgi:hypothetical protein
LIYIIQPYLCLLELLGNPILTCIQQLKGLTPYPFDRTNLGLDNNPSLHLPNLTSLPKWIRDKYADVFNAQHAKILPAYKQTDHAIDIEANAILPF